MCFLLLLFCSPSFVLSFPVDSEDAVSDLSHLGSSIFGKPSETTGELVEKWSEHMGVNPEELGEYAEGDILFPEMKTKNGLIASAARWPDNIIPFEFRGSFTSKERRLIFTAMNMYHNYTCIRFRPRNSYDTDYISFDNQKSGCWSSVGRVGGPQVVNLQSPGCLVKIGTPIHEILHAVGFQHEQNRWERDSYVNIMWDNIQQSRKDNFKKSDKSKISGYGVPYDYNSVMHYSAKAFSNNGRDTIVPLVRGVTIGQRDGFSKKDIEKINAMYKCEKSNIGGGYAVVDENNTINNNVDGNEAFGLGSLVSWLLPDEQSKV